MTTEYSEGLTFSDDGCIPLFERVFLFSAYDAYGLLSRSDFPQIKSFDLPSLMTCRWQEPQIAIVSASRKSLRSPYGCKFN